MRYTQEKQILPDSDRIGEGAGAKTAHLAVPLLLAALLGSATARGDDLGPKPGSDTANVSIALKLHDTDNLAAFINSTITAGDPHFHRFLTVDQFTARYSPSVAEVNQVRAKLEAAGIHVTGVTANRLVIKATATVSALNGYFGVSIHEFSNAGQRFHAPTASASIPTEIGGSVIGVAGLSTEAKFTTHKRSVQDLLGTQPQSQLPAPDSGTGTGVPQQFTVGDVAQLYQVQPLYRAGFKGRGRTVGIATLATFDQADAYAYWDQIGLQVKPNRITEVAVDGGAGTDGADETTLDVQQSGGLAPQAKIIVYEGPNTDQGFLDVFVQAVVDNQVDTLSSSWGLPEILTTPGIPEAENQVFMEAAAQGISIFASSGDSGAYDVNGLLPYGVYSDILTVDDPCSSPYVTAAGGTTIATTLHLLHGDVVVPKDRPWAWDYLQNYLTANYGADFYFNNYFPVGGGGGVSLDWFVPRYQQHVRGVMRSAPGQSLFYYPNYPDLSGAQDLIDLPAGFPGRNVPDVSLNADPFTGYLLYFQGAWEAGWGGTSFVAPQLNGIFSVISQSVGGRLGFLNPDLYRGAKQGGYNGSHSEFNDITTADNLFYKGVRGYDPATGIGTINAANLASRLARGERDDDGDDDN